MEISPARHLRPKSLSGVPLEGSDLVRLVYVDEAGMSKPSHEPFVTVAAVIVKAGAALEALETHLNGLVEKWIPEPQREGFVFSAKRIIHGTKEGSGLPFEREHPDWPLEKRLAIADDLAAIPKDFGLPVAFGWIEKANFPGGLEIPVFWPSLKPKDQLGVMHAFSYLVAAMFVERWMSANTVNEHCLMIVEDNSTSRSRIRDMQTHHQRVQTTFTAEHRRHFPLVKIREEPLFQQKRQYSVLQVADFCAYIFKRTLMNDPYAERFMHPIKSQMITSRDYFAMSLS